MRDCEGTGRNWTASLRRRGFEALRRNRLRGERLPMEASVVNGVSRHLSDLLDARAVLAGIREALRSGVLSGAPISRRGRSPEPSYFPAQILELTRVFSWPTGARLVQSRTKTTGAPRVLFGRAARSRHLGLCKLTARRVWVFSKHAVAALGLRRDSLKSPEHFFRKCLD